MTAYNQRAFINNTVVMRWLDFKSIIVSKNIFIQYADGVEKYQIFAFDGSVAYFTELYKSPYSSQVQYDPDYSQSQNDTDRVDFETNYQSTANQVISSDNRAFSDTINFNGDIASLSSRGAGNIGVQITGVWVGTLQFEISVDGTNWVSTFAFPIDNSNAGVNSTNTNGAWRILGGGVSAVRVRASAFASGSATIYFQTTASASTVRVAQGATTGAAGNGWIVRLSDGSNIIATAARPIPTSMKQGVTTSAVNSSTVNLAAGATFTGTSDSTLGVNSIQINVKSDQPITIQVQQSDEGTNWDIVDTYSVAANTGDGRTIQATASFVRVIATNNGSSTTTFFRLQTVLAPIADVLPRALTQEGNLKVAIQNLDGYTIGTSSNPIRIDPIGTTIQPISGTVSISGTTTISGIVTSNQGTNPWTSDITDRANRLVGVVYGSQGQQIKQTASDFNSQVEIAVGSSLIDPRSIRALTSSDVITANAGSGTFAISASSLPLPSGAATETTLAARLADATFTNRINTQGQKTMATSTPVVIASDQTAFPVSSSGNFTVVQATAANLNATVVGTITANAGSGTFAISAASLPLPSEASTETTLATRLADSTFTNRVNTQGQKAMSASTPVVIASDQASFPITGSGNFTVVQATASNLNATVSGTITANIGTSGSLALDASVVALQVSQGSTTSGQKGDLIQAAVSTSNPSYTNGQTNPLSLTTTGLLRVDASGATQPISGTITANVGTTNGLMLDATFSNRINTQGQKAMSASTPVVIASDQTTIIVKELSSTTATLTNVAASASSVTLLASNANRIGATIFNDSGTSALYVKFGTTASTSSYTVQIAAGGYYEVPFNYTGRIDGIWSLASGNARVSELS